MSARPVCNVVVNAHRKRIRLLENHAYIFSEQVHIGGFGKNVQSVIGALRGVPAREDRTQRSAAVRGKSRFANEFCFRFFSIGKQNIAFPSILN